MNQQRPLKAVVLAAGCRSITEDGLPVLLQELGGKKIINYIMENVAQVAAPEDTYVVVSYCADAIRNHLGPGYHYVTQESPRGTGDAVLAVREHLGDFNGDLLILYGDTPLFSPTSIRGLINRHRLRGAELTLLTAVANRPYPYGRVIRDSAGRIIDIIEEAQASTRIKDIRELNVGAYVVSAREIWPALETLTPSPLDGELRLTDLAHRLITRGHYVESYQIYDQDEIQGINTRDDLERAEFILQKRYFRPRIEEERNIIQFGTGGWRAVIGEGFTLHNVRRLCQALANDITRRGLEQRGVLIGYDRRFLSDRAAQAAAEVFAGNNIHTILLTEDAPTPLIEFATASACAAYGLAFTASHNPPEWNGLKVFHGDGALLMTDETSKIEDETNSLSLEDVVKIPLEVGLEAGVIEKRSFTNAYIDRVESFIDLPAIREAGLKVIVDPMYGVGHLTLGIILNEARCRVTFIHERHNPLFGGRSPAPDLEALRMLRAYVREDHYALGLATDGDADRIAVIDERGEYVPTNDLLLLLYWYLHEVRGQRGGVVRNLSTTHLLDRLAAALGEKSVETPVGFKWIAAGMAEHNALLGGESSGGLTIRGHIKGKDGIFASVLIIEMLAKTKRRISELLEHVWGITGRLYTAEDNVAATADMRIIIPQRVKRLVESKQMPYPLLKVRDDDGTKLYFENDAWALLRFSGTEPVLRISAEAETPEKAREMVDWLKGYAFDT
ncbi:MAG: NTP transferase domain-containing protein [Chloroflexi bacterium]|nr:NTP transferase domain-containing protein [Chloroflexota bacterium]